MIAKFAVTVTVDTDAASATLRPAGLPTPDNVHGITAVLRGAERVLPACAVLLHLAQFQIGSPEALRSRSGSGAEILRKKQIIPRGCSTGHVPDFDVGMEKARNYDYKARAPDVSSNNIGDASVSSDHS
ncbi:MAG TPA: hypothetical protein VLT34_18130 [Arthrobacter sp.]|nr:hypothetical protein [Arthrobacter sp.]